jgi:thymidylate synthase
MNNLDTAYQQLLRDILENGNSKDDRTGTGTLSAFGRQIRHKMSEGFPLLTTKKMAWNSIVTELLWFLKGDTNIKYLVENGCNIWNGDAYKRFTYYTDEESSMERFIELIKTDDEFSQKWGELGPIYGHQWRNWNDGIDQIQNLINDLKTNPDSRRLMVNAWAVHDLPDMVLPPCHYGLQVYTRELSLDERLKLWDTKFGFANEEQKNQFNHNVHLDTHGIPKRAISLMWNQRSVDTFLGLPFNIASYGLLLEIIAKQVNMIPDELIGNLGDTHLYLNHIDQAREQISRTSYELPKLKMNPIFLANLEHKGFDEAINGQVNFKLENYYPHPSIKAPLSN